MAGPQEIWAQVKETIVGLTTVQKIAVVAVVVATIGGLLALVMTGDSTANYQVLYSNLANEDAGEIVTKIKELRVPYKLSEDGRAILVAGDKLHETRLTLAGGGLPRGGGVGFEIFDKTKLGATDFEQRLNYQRALQGELARTIQKSPHVLEARIHIAAPKESVFIEESKPPSASVSLKLRDREKPAQQQIQAIVNLVAGAVPGLTTENITVVDTTGRLLFRRQEGSDVTLTANQLEYQLKIEETLRKKVESMLEEVVGAGKAIARVTASIDFSKINVTEENFDPEGQVPRSEQVLTEESFPGGERPAGIPGAKGNLATYSEAGSEGGAQGEGFKKSNMTRNYEISRRTRQIQEQSGVVKKLSVAVMVDGIHDKVVDKEGKARLEYKARTPEEIKQFAAITRNAIGFDEERGDQVEVANVSFAASQVLEPEVTVVDKVMPLIQSLAMPLSLLLIAIFFMLFVAKPLFRLITTKRTEGEISGVMIEKKVKKGEGLEEEEEEEDLSFAAPKITDKERIYRLAQSDPDRAADLVRRWLREE